MKNIDVQSLLELFSNQNNIQSKGQLCVVLVVTRLAKGSNFPFDPDEFITQGNGQVKGLGKSAVQGILQEYGITKVLAEEGGRTSRGSLGLMKSYIRFLNENLREKSELENVEAYWILSIKRFFDAKPFIIHLDRSKSLYSAFQDLMKQAEYRQKESPGTTYLGALFQHLVGAKLLVVFPERDIQVNGYAVADQPKQRNGDFEVGDSAIHVTTFPTENLLAKCVANLKMNLRPVVITSARGVIVAETIADNIGIRERLEIIEIAQFLSANVLEWSQFDSAQNQKAMQNLIEAYNVIIEKNETDPSLKIKLI